MMAINSDNQCICPAAIYERSLTDKIVQGKEKLRQATETTTETPNDDRTSSSHPTTTVSDQLDLYQTTVPGSTHTHDRGPRCLQEVLMIDFLTFLSTNRDTPTVDKNKIRMDSAIIFYNMGLIHHKNGSLDEALKLFKRAESTIPQSSKSQALVAVANNTGQIHYRRGDLEVSMEYFRKALRLGREAMLQDDIGESEMKRVKIYVGTVLSNMGRVYFARQQYSEALDKCKESLDTRAIAHSRGHVDVTTTLYNLGLIYQRKGEMEEALKMYRQFLSHVKTISTTESFLSCQDAAVDLAVSLNHVGQTFEKLDKLSEAMNCYNHALRLGSTRISNHRIFAVILRNIGTIHFRTSTCLEALHALKLLLGLLLSSLGNNHPDVAAVIHNIGVVQLKAGMVTEALKSFTESFRIRRSVLGSDDHHVAKSLYQIGLIYQEMGEHKKAIDVFRETVRVRKVALGPDHHDVAVTLFRIGQVYHHRGHLNKALKVFHEALTIERARDNRTAGGFVANISSLIGRVHLEKGKVNKAVAYFTEAARISQRTLFTNHGSSLSSIIRNAFHTTFINTPPTAAATA